MPLPLRAMNTTTKPAPARNALKVRTAVRAGIVEDVSASAIGALVFQAPRPVQR